jgi:hypothetical protein
MAVPNDVANTIAPKSRKSKLRQEIPRVIIGERKNRGNPAADKGEIRIA